MKRYLLLALGLLASFAAWADAPAKSSKQLHVGTTGMYLIYGAMILFWGGVIFLAVHLHKKKKRQRAEMESR